MPRFPNRTSPASLLFPCLGLGVVVFLVLAPPTHAGVGLWTPLGPDGGDIRTLAVAPSNPDVIYAATRSAGIYRSTDGGGTWTLANRGLPIGEPVSLAVDPSRATTVYAALLNQGLFKSTDGGTTWTSSSRGAQPFGAILLFSVAVDPRQPRTVYAGTGEGVWWSANGGDTWKPRNTGLPVHTQVLTLTADRTGTLYAGTVDDGVFRGANRGARWQSAGTGLPQGQIRALAVDPSSSGTTVLAGTFAGVYRNTGGRSWTFAGGPADTVLSLAFQRSFQRSGRACAGYVSAGIFRSADAGATWQPALDGPPAGAVFALAAGPETVFAGLAEGHPVSGGLYRSLDAGATWEPSQSGLTGLSVRHVAVDPSDSRTIYATADPAALFKTTDRGQSWTPLDFGAPAETTGFIGPLLIDPAHPATVYAGCDPCGPLLRSDDGGATWQRLPADTGAVFDLATDPGAAGALWAAADGLFHSADRGATWERQNLGTTDSDQLIEVEVSPRDPAVVYVTGEAVFPGRPPRFEPRIFRTADGGATWARRDAGLPQEPILALALDPADAATLWVALLSGGIYRSTDSGLTWTLVSRIPGNLESSLVADLTASPPAALYLVRQTFGSPSSVLRSLDEGRSWTPLRTGLGVRIPEVLVVDPGDPRQLLLGTLNGSVLSWTEPDR